MAVLPIGSAEAYSFFISGEKVLFNTALPVPDTQSAFEFEKPFSALECTAYREYVT